MSLTLLSPPLSPPLLFFKTPLLRIVPPIIISANNHPLIANCTNKDGHGLTSDKSDKFIINDDLLRNISGVKGARQVLDLITEFRSNNEALNIETSDCNLMIEAAFERGNADLALSLFDAMRLGFIPDDMIDNKIIKWSQPDIFTCQLVIKGLAASLRVSDAIKIINYVSKSGFSSGEEVSFGMIIRCPTCKIAIAVVQPQDETQVASCSKCRYQYELASGDIISIESEEINKDASIWEKAFIFLRVKKDEFPVAIHSIVIKTPSGTAGTCRFATKTRNVPAQVGERVTISLAAPSSSFNELGPLKLGPRPKTLKPGEPMCITNHVTSQVLDLLQPPDSRNRSGLTGLLYPYPLVMLSAISVLTNGDNLAGFVDLGLVKLVSGSVIASFSVGTVINQVVLPELRKLPKKTVDIIAFKQQLLSQYDMLQNRIKDLKQAAEKEVWMLARMSQLESKIIAIGEPSYRARRGRVKRVIDNLESALKSRIELIESYAKISSMIEIEVEMDSDVLAAESAINAERISEQIQQIMEIDNLEEQWRIQAEANDEVERLLNTGT